MPFKIAEEILNNLLEEYRFAKINSLSIILKKMEVRKPTNEEVKKAETWPIWEKEQSKFDWHYDQQETCYLLQGQVTVTTADGKSVNFGAGDLVVFPQGLSCVWDIQKPVRKHYNFG